MKLLLITLIFTFYGCKMVHEVQIQQPDGGIDVHLAFDLLCDAGTLE